MQNKRDKKKTANTIKVRDLKPVKNAKGGWPPDPCGPKKLQSSRLPNTLA
jgi:hypothetical protein